MLCGRPSSALHPLVRAPPPLARARSQPRWRCVCGSIFDGPAAQFHSPPSHRAWWRPATTMEGKEHESDGLPASGAVTGGTAGQQHERAGDVRRDGFGRELTDMDRQYAAQTGVERRVHIAGTGSIGKLVAHSLRGLPKPPPVTLVFHRYRLLDAWNKGKRQITLEDDGVPISHGGFDVELARPLERRHGVEIDNKSAESFNNPGKARPHEVAQALKQDQTEVLSDPDWAGSAKGTAAILGQAGNATEDNTIHNLIITTKAAYTVPALLALRHRLKRDSTICFLQNGMGILDDVNEQVFPDVETRPNYMQGIITHGVNVPPQKADEDPFFAVHAGHGTIAVGLLPRQGLKACPPSPDGRSSPNDNDSGSESEGPNKIKPDQWAPSSRYLIRTLTRSPVLCAVGFTPAELLQQQLEKLAVNSVLNVLTALLDNRNGSLLYNFALTRTMRLMLAETSQVIRSLPELQHIPNVAIRFDPERLETLVVSVAHKTRDNISSMLADVRAGRQTEVEYINGYIVKRGEEMGVKCVVNYAMMQTVIGKAKMISKELDDAVPEEGKRLNPE